MFIKYTKTIKKRSYLHWQQAGFAFHEALGDTPKYLLYHVTRENKIGKKQPEEFPSQILIVVLTGCSIFFFKFKFIWIADEGVQGELEW